MKNKLIKVAAVVFGLVFAGSLATTPVFADDAFCTSKAEMGEAAWKAMGCDGSQQTAENVVTNVLKAIIAILGIVAVIFIVIGGVGYMTSSGDAGKVKKAKDTILYAVIGLVICALAFAIVNFAASIINDSGNNASVGSKNAVAQIEYKAA